MGKPEDVLVAAIESIRDGLLGGAARGPLYKEAIDALAAYRSATYPTESAPAPRYFTCRCTRDHGATGCSGTGSSVSGGLCAWCVAEHRTPPDVKGALAWLWSAYGLAGGARGDIRRAMAMLGDDPPEEDESPPATGLPCDTLEGAEACEECNGAPGLTDETKGEP